MLPIKLSHLASLINETLAISFGSRTFWVIADITNHNYKAKDDWHFFTLAEKETGTNAVVAKVDAVSWKAGSIQIREFERVTGQRFTNNISVLVNVSVEFNAAHGLKLRMHAIDPSFTIGVLEQAKQTTLLQLLNDCPDYIRKAGDRYLTKNNQLTLNRVIQRIAIIASDETAGYEDFVHTLRSNIYGYSFFMDNYFTAVQGTGNASQLRDRLISIFQTGIFYDAVVLIRGGGGQTDLLMFDNYLLGQAIAKFPIPVITGIGHQRNETIVDMMAHSPQHAPTKAAEFIISHNQHFEQELLQFRQLIVIRAQQVISSQYQTVSQLQGIVVNESRTLVDGHRKALSDMNQSISHAARSIIYRKQVLMAGLLGRVIAAPRMLVAAKKSEIRQVIQRAHSFSRTGITRKQESIAHYISLFNMMSPANILKKGFAVVKMNGHIVSDPANIAPGNAISIILADKELNATVQSINDHDGKEFNL